MEFSPVNVGIATPFVAGGDVSHKALSHAHGAIMPRRRSFSETQIGQLTRTHRKDVSSEQLETILNHKIIFSDDDIDEQLVRVFPEAGK